MLVVTAKLTRKKLIAGVLAIGFCICGIVVLFAGFDDTASVSSEVNVSAEAAMPERIKTPEDRVHVLTSFGWTIEPDPIEFMEVRIPDEFDATYAQYNEVQKEQGFNLEKYAGKHVMKYSYIVTNHPSGEDQVVATILVYKNKLIGGDVSSAKMDGFLQGLTFPK